MSSSGGSTSRGARRSARRRALRHRPARLDTRIRRLHEENKQPPDHEKRLGRGQGRSDGWQQRHRLRIESKSTFDRGPVTQVVNTVRRSGVVPYLDAYLLAHPGPSSSIGAEALLVGLLLATWEYRSGRRTDIARAFASLSPEHRFNLGLYHPDTYAPPSYRQVAAQTLRLVRALDKGWVTADGVKCDYDWFATCLLRASIPRQHLKHIKNTTVDGTSWESRAEVIFSTKSQNQNVRDEDRSPSPLNTPEKFDKLADYWKTVSDSDGELAFPGVSEVPLPGVGRRKLAGTLGPDGRLISSADGSARWGWSTGTASRKEGYFNGYEVHFVRAIPAQSSGIQAIRAGENSLE